MRPILIRLVNLPSVIATTFVKAMVKYAICFYEEFEDYGTSDTITWYRCTRKGALDAARMALTIDGVNKVSIIRMSDCQEVANFERIPLP